MEDLLQRLLQRIDRYMEESLDENFDRYLEQMKQILREHPEQMGEVSRSVEENMQRYRANQELQRQNTENCREELREAERTPELRETKRTPELREAERMPELQEAERMPEPREEERTPEPRETAGVKGSSVEFKIGIGVLSGIGVLFVLIGLVILARNFLPDVVQGMMMLCFFALVWILSQLCMPRIAQKVSLGCTAAGIVGVYLSVILNYYVFDSFSEWLTCGLFAAVSLIAWAAGRASRSCVIQCTGVAGFLFFGLFLPWGGTIPAYIVMLVVTVLLNVLWQFGCSGKYVYGVQMTHQIMFPLCSLLTSFLLTLEGLPGGPALILVYCVVIAILINLFYLNREDVGFFVVWLCSLVLLSAYLTGVCFANMINGNVWWNCVFLALAGANTVFLFVKQFRWHYQGLYYQSAAVLLLLANCDHVWWVGLLGTVLLFLAGLWKLREHHLLQEMIMLAILSLEILSIPTDFAFLISLLLMVLAILAIVAGFVRQEMPLRIYGLCLALFACAKVVLHDFWGLQLLQKSLLFLGVGTIAIAIALVYAVLEHRQKKTEQKEAPFPEADPPATGGQL